MATATSATTLGSGPAAQGNVMPTLAAPFDPVPKDDIARKSEVDEEKKKHKKRSLFGFGKKKAEENEQSRAAPTGKEAVLASTQRSNQRKPSSPSKTEITSYPSSPHRGALGSSPRLGSPAGSQIFERDVQEPTAVIPGSPAIPAHITTENHIPPVLEASTQAITDGHLSPDSVEIITHNAHQPAAVTVTGAPQETPSWVEELASFAERAEVDSVSNYGSIDNADVRRLSFISFADVVQAEHHSGPGAASRESVHVAGLTSLASFSAANRSPSPIRSPVSSQGPGTSPPTSKSGSVKGLELSPARKTLASPAPSGHVGELNIETMSQALRRTGSRDLSGVRSVPTSPMEGPSR